MKVWEVRGKGIDSLSLSNRKFPKNLKDNEVLVKMKAATLNYRDLIMVAGGYGDTGGSPPFIPISDGSGIIVDLGSKVKIFNIKDIVIPTFFQGWNSGNIKEDNILLSLGGKVDGVMQEYMVFSEDNLVNAPKDWNFKESASLPCAALTAWRTLVTEGKINQDSTVLAQGLGGVSLFAIQIAKLFNAKVIVTTSNKGRMFQAKNMGADFVINYNESQEWWRDIQNFTNRKGVDIIVEVGGSETIAQSIKSSKTGAVIGIIGVLSGGMAELPIGRIIYKASRLIGITCGNKNELIDMIKKFNSSSIKPIIDSTFKFNDLPSALKYMKEGKHMGKIAIEFE